MHIAPVHVLGQLIGHYSRLGLTLFQEGKGTL